MVKEIHELDQKVYDFSIFQIHSNAPGPTLFPLLVLYCPVQTIRTLHLEMWTAFLWAVKIF